jgi:hypothetical protein
MSPGKPQDRLVAKRRRASQRLSSRTRLRIHDPRETKIQDAGKATTNIATPTQKPSAANMSPGSHKTRFWQTDAKRRNAYRRDADSILYFSIMSPWKTQDMTFKNWRGATWRVATPTQDAIFCPDEPRNTIEHNVGKPMPSFATYVIATPQNTPHLAHVRFQMQQETTLGNRPRASRRQSSRCSRKTTYLA